MCAGGFGRGALICVCSSRVHPALSLGCSMKITLTFSNDEAAAVVNRALDRTGRGSATHAEAIAAAPAGTEATNEEASQ